MPARLRSTIASIAVAASLLGIGVPCAAQPAEKDAAAAARQAFTEGKDLEKAGDYPHALERFKKVAEFRVTPQVRFHIALCEENLGKLVSALRGFELAAEDARQAGSSAIEVVENAPKRAAALKKRVAHLKLEIKGHLRTSQLTVDGVRVTPDRVADEQLVDPGKHAVLVVRGADPVFDKEITLAEGASETVVIEVEDPDPAAVAPPPPPPPPPPPSRLPAYIAGGVGVAALGTAGVLMGISLSDAASVKDVCHGPNAAGVYTCPLGAQAQGDEGKTLHTTSLVVGGVGVAAVATGVVLFILRRPKPAPSTPAAWTLAPTRTGLSFAARF